MLPDRRARSRLRHRVLAWYAAAGRPLAFRATVDPWAILVSEVMAQQTQAARAADAWSRFMASYPTPAALAGEPLAEVLRAWRGLGYNRRAIALRRAAQVIVRDHRGRVPDELEALERLPGVGPYTARAVAALAFGIRVGAVDTNVRRVLGRAFFDPNAGAPGARHLQVLADELAPPRVAGRWTHALMDVGATLCRRTAPRCTECPLRTWCRFAASEVGAGGTAASGRRHGASTPTSASVRAAASARRRPAFETTSRWLRGRILDRLRDLDDGSWLPFDGPLGGHDEAAVTAALAGLARDGLIELRLGSPPEARLPIA